MKIFQWFDMVFGLFDCDRTLMDYEFNLLCYGLFKILETLIILKVFLSTKMNYIL